MVRFFYFGETVVDSTGEACMFPLSSFLGISGSATLDTSILHFKARNGTANADTVTILHSGYDHRQFSEELAHFMQVNQRDPFLIMTSGSLTAGTANFVTWKIKSATVTTQA